MFACECVSCECVSVRVVCVYVCVVTCSDKDFARRAFYTAITRAPSMSKLWFAGTLAGRVCQPTAAPGCVGRLMTGGVAMAQFAPFKHARECSHTAVTHAQPQDAACVAGALGSLALVSHATRTLQEWVPAVRDKRALCRKVASAIRGLRAVSSLAQQVPTATHCRVEPPP